MMLDWFTADWFDAEWPMPLLATSVRLALFAVLAACALTLLRTREAKWHRWVWGVVLLQSFVVSPLLIELPWLPPETSDLPRSSSAAIPSRLSPPIADGTFAPGISPSSLVSANIVERSSLLAVVWLAGVLAWTSFLVLSQWVVFRMRRSAASAREDWQKQLDSVAAEVGIQPVQLLVHPSCGPLLTRGLNPFQPNFYIVVPRGTWSSLSSIERDAILRHELAHLARGDLWKSACMRFVAAFHWFNPLAWWCVAKFDEAAEWACDARVRDQNESSATALASALLSVSPPPRLVRLGVSTARGSRVSKRIHRLIGPSPVLESKMKKFAILSFILVAVLAGSVRFGLIAQEGSGGGSRESIGTQVANIADQLAKSKGSTEQRLAKALVSQAGKIVLEDGLQNRVAEAESELQGNAVESALARHFDLESSPPTLRDGQQEWRSEMIVAATSANEDVEQLTKACSEIAEKLRESDEVTLLVKRFLSEENGPKFLYMTKLHEMMQPGPAMLADSIGRSVAMNASGKYQIRPDAREQIEQIVAMREQSQKLTKRLHDELTYWTDEIVDRDEFHSRLKKNASNPKFASFIIAKQVFEQKQLEANMVLKIMDQLDAFSVDTAAGLTIQSEAQDEIEELLGKFELTLPRLEGMQPVLDAFRKSLDTSLALEKEFSAMLATDVALIAVSENTEMVNAGAGQLVRALLGEAIEETDSEVSLVKDENVRQEIYANIQKALREMRGLRRRTMPLRNLAEEFAKQELSPEDGHLAEALHSVAMVLYIRGEVEGQQAALAAKVLEQWKSENFETNEDGALKIRDEAQASVEQYLQRVEETGQELADDDF
ncbi:MAG: M56 family metallopeptidase [Planctomycetota bacterium]